MKVYVFLSRRHFVCSTPQEFVEKLMNESYFLTKTQSEWLDAFGVRFKKLFNIEDDFSTPERFVERLLHYGLLRIEELH